MCYSRSCSPVDPWRGLSLQEGTGGSGMATDRVKNLQNEVEGVKNIMSQNVERILARGENLDHLRNKTEDLEATVSPGSGRGPGSSRLGETPILCS